MRHDVPGAQIPGIVLPESKDSTGLQRVVDVGESCFALRERDVVKDTVAIGDVDFAMNASVIQHGKFAAWIVRRHRGSD